MNDADTRRIAQIAEMIDQEELDGAPTAEIPGFDDDVNTGPPPLPEPADMAFGGPDEVGAQISSETVTMSRDFLYELLRLTKERAGGPCDTCDEPPIEPPIDGELEAPEFEADADIDADIDAEGGEEEFGGEEAEGEEAEGEEVEEAGEEAEEAGEEAGEEAEEAGEEDDIEVEESIRKIGQTLNEAEDDDSDGPPSDDDGPPSDDDSESDDSESDSESDDSDSDGPPSDDDSESDDSDSESDDSDSDGPPPELADSDEGGEDDSIPFEPGAEAGAEIDSEIDDTDPPDGGLDHADIDEVVNKLVELSAGGETLTMHDLPEIVQCCFPDPVSDIGDMDELPIDEPPIDGPPIDEPPIDGPPIDEPPIDGPPIDEPPIDEPPIDEPPIDEPEDIGGEEVPEGPPADEDLPFESMKSVDEMNVIDEKLAKTKAVSEHNESVALAKSIAGFARKLKINVAMKPAKSENGAEYLGDEETFPKLCEAINKTLATIKEGKKKTSVGAMSKYSRCYPVSGAGRLFYVFK